MMYKVLLSISILALTGCSSMPYDWHFECPEKKGKPCVMMSTINTMIDEKGIESLEDSPCNEGKCCSKKVRKPALSQKKVVIQTYFPSSSVTPQKSVQEGDSGDSTFPVVELSDSPSFTFLRRRASLYDNGGIWEGEEELPASFPSQHELPPPGTKVSAGEKSQTSEECCK